MRTLDVTNRSDWRAWLEKHHKNEREVWLVYSKKHTGKPRIPYEDAVEEALCFGWIDSIVRRIDDERYMQKFTPRKDGSEWSKLNRNRMRKLIRGGKMTPAGLAKFTPAAVRKLPREKPAVPKVLPNFIKQAFVEDREVWENFNSLAPSHRKQYVLWISVAKKQETRERRLKEAMRLLKQNRKLGLK